MMTIFRTIICVSVVTGGMSMALAQSGGPAYCRMYSSTTSGTVSNAIKRNPSCVDYSKGVHNNYKMHYDWCMRTPSPQVESAANHIRELVNRCSRRAQRPAANSSTTRWSGVWKWVRPMVFHFGSGPAPTGPGPRDVTVRKSERATFELLPNNRVKICIGRNPCSFESVTSSNGRFNINAGSSGFITVWTNDQGRSLNGQFWWDRKKRNQITPDATIFLRQ